MKNFFGRIVFSVTFCFDDCPPLSAGIDENGYRLVLRHTGNQITIEDFMQLYLKRFLSGPFVNDVKNSHFRDPMLPFYWLETNGVRLDAFDTQGLKSSSIYFRTLSGNSTTWPFLFENNCLLVENNTQISYTDMGELCAYSSFRPKSVDGLSQKAVFFLEQVPHAQMISLFGPC